MSVPKGYITSVVKVWRRSDRVLKWFPWRRKTFALGNDTVAVLTDGEGRYKGAYLPVPSQPGAREVVLGEDELLYEIPCNFVANMSWEGIHCKPYDDVFVTIEARLRIVRPHEEELPGRLVQHPLFATSDFASRAIKTKEEFCTVLGTAIARLFTLPLERHFGAHEYDKQESSYSSLCAAFDSHLLGDKLRCLEAQSGGGFSVIAVASATDMLMTALRYQGDNEETLTRLLGARLERESRVRLKEAWCKLDEETQLEVARKLAKVRVLEADLRVQRLQEQFDLIAAEARKKRTIVEKETKEAKVKLARIQIEEVSLNAEMEKFGCGLVEIPLGPSAEAAKQAAVARELGLFGAIRDEYGHEFVLVGCGKEVFYMGKYPVTREQWGRFYAHVWHPIRFFLYWRSGKRRGRQDSIRNVSWYGTQDYCARLRARAGLNYDIPTSAQLSCLLPPGAASGSGPSRPWGCHSVDGPELVWCKDKLPANRRLRVLRRGPGVFGRPPRCYGIDAGFRLVLHLDLPSLYRGRTIVLGGTT